jgi:hypothetical protein
MGRDLGHHTWRTAALLLVIAVGLGAVSLTLLGSQVSGILSTVGSSVSHPGDGSGGGDAPVDGGGGDSGSDGGGDTSDGGSTPGSGNDVPLLGLDRPELLIIKTGELSLQVDSIDAALAAATQSIARLGGYVSGSSRSGTGDEASATVTFRIPADRWDEALPAMREVGTVLDEQTGTEDVTGTVVDLEARVRNLRTTEAALQAIMDDATVIKDVLTVQHELTTVRGEIERLQSEAAHLREKAASSTLTVHLGLTPAPAVVQQEARFDAATEAEAATAHLVEVIQALQKVGIWFGIVWLPILVSLGIVGTVGLVLARRLHGRFRSGVPPFERWEDVA